MRLVHIKYPGSRDWMKIRFKWFRKLMLIFAPKMPTYDDYLRLKEYEAERVKLLKDDPRYLKVKT